MIDSGVIQQVLSIQDDRSGDHAQDGFDFQVSTAIYLMFDEIKQGNDFSLVYEKIDDFIMFVDNIRIYQSKSTSKSLTENDLYKKDSSEKKTTSKKSAPSKVQVKKAPAATGLSIIEKIQKNINVIKDTVDSIEVKAHLLWNKDFKFGASLLRGTSLETNIPNLVLSNISETVKKKITDKTGLSKCDWENIEVVRLLSKEHHEVLTCSNIEDVIHNRIGPNTSYSKAFYASLSRKITTARNTKEPILSSFILTEIDKLKTIPIAPKPADYQHLLTESDFKNNIVHINVREIFFLQANKNNPVQKELLLVEQYINQNYNKITFPCHLHSDLKVLPEFEDLFLLHSEEKIKAIIVNAYLNKER